MKLTRTFLALIVCLGFVTGCSDRPEEPRDARDDEHDQGERLSLSAEAYDAARITVAPVALRTVTPTIKVTGTLSYDERHMAIATARIGGRITDVVADFGQRVSAGEVLAWIDSPELGAAEADYRRAESATRLRQAEYERAELLLEGDAISRGALLRREADWYAAEAEMHTAEQKLRILGLSQADIAALPADRTGVDQKYPVRSSIEGLVTERNAVSGRVVSADEELFTVAELDSLWLFLQVFEKDLHAVRKGAAVTLTCESHPEDRFRGTIDFVGQVLDPHSRTARARAVIGNPEGELKPGMFVYASIEGGGADVVASPGLAVPVTATARVEGRMVVFVLSAERTFEVREVELGVASGDWVEVRGGLSEGESIAVSGVFTLKSEVLKGGLEEHHH